MKFVPWLKRMPWSVLLVAVLLILTGWVGIARCEQFLGVSGRFLHRQMVWSALAMVTMVVVAVPNYRIIARWTPAIYLAALALLLVVYLFDPINGARRWIRLGPVGLQPSEFAKIAYVLALARYLMYRTDYRRLSGILIPIGLTLIPVFLILREPDLGTALIFFPVMFLMLFAAGARWIDLSKLALCGMVALPLLWTQMSREQRSRVTALVQQAGPEDSASDDAYHLRQAKQMIALGGVWGSLAGGPVLDTPRAYRLPEAHTDFIFCVLGERLGLPGLALVLGLYAFLVWRGLAIAKGVREPFGRLVAVGLVGLIGVQVLINTAMTVGLLPITGLSLPMISYGGSSLLAQGVLLGLLMNIAMRPGYEVAAEPFRFETK